MSQDYIWAFVKRNPMNCIAERFGPAIRSAS